ncbi:NADH-quinone oxidoreductase subunit J family protein [Mucilaginibacter ginkgonis]|uniref:NADH-quinone oxidoreductase subunit J n=1 Tax=Mucilaginibacter ginkgonis TaxID=2682091 RepID=A0A6I4I3D1_9SPHI|nr:NADH-quinone oxidoreductase subunit J [Mucilaginibacter ginkgonis]QQL48471.1 NADH-quinone oxidoreductase subunit J [Mucilaginibacter ginkgonis]
MTLENIIFYFLSAVVVGSALMIASGKNLVRSVFLFFVTLFALAGIYVLALADFVAITQIVIYVGGILVLIIFAFMLSGKEALSTLQKADNTWFRIGNLPALLISALFLLVLVNLFLKTDIGNSAWLKESVSDNDFITDSGEMTANIGTNLMTRYLLPFEVISVLLLMALVGAAHLSRKEEGVQ